jgi:hypothetical protein
MFSYIQGKKIRTGKLWMKCVTPEQMKARAGKITFCGKHKHHSKTLRDIQRLKQDENALKISRGTHLCYNVNFFFSGENIQHAIVPCQRKNQHTY